MEGWARDHDTLPAASPMTLPLVLVGPIVRRVDAPMASVFVALSRPAGVELRIWEGVQVARAGQLGTVRSGAAPLQSATARTRRLGEQLHVAVAVAELAAPLLPGRRHSYDLVLTPDGAPASDLRANGLLAEGRVIGADPEAPASLPLGYDEDALPGFVTCPARIEDLRVAQASCRRTDKRGDDALAYLDELIGARVEGSVPQPHQLVLTGDQVYADGLAAPLLAVFDAVGREMLGGPSEELPLADGSTLIGDTLRLPPLHRQRLCSLEAMLSTREGHSHAFSLAEFCGLYALSFSTSVWRAIPGPDDFPDLSGIGPQHRERLTDWETRLAGRPDELAEQMRALRRRWADHARAAAVFRAALPHVARVLANVPTYMIFDDHEVSDDWNLTATHRRRMLGSPLGARVILNAMSAVTVFQAWGNDPRRFEPPAGAPQTDEARLLTAVLERDMQTAGALLGLRVEQPDVPVRFGFTVDGPAHRLLAIDTRHHRDFPSGFGPPALIRPEQIDDQIPEGPLPAGLEVLLLASPAPVLHPPLVDRIGQPLAAAALDLAGALGYARRRVAEEDAEHPEGRRPDELGLVGSSATEVELWYGDRDAFERLLERLSAYPRVVILSGDVHFSVSLALDTWLARNLPGASSRIVQLTGSGARNHWGGIVALVLRAFRPFQELLALAAPATELKWERSDQPPVEGVAGRRELELRLQENPVRVPAAGWPPGSVQRRPVDFAHRLALLSDVRSDAERSSQLGALLPPFPAIDPASPLPGYALTLQRHQSAMRLSAQVRTLVYPHNVGEVSFALDGGDGALRVIHDIYARVEHAGAGVRGELLTRHESPLEPSADPRPTIEVEAA